jgi:hypothetical protein
VILPPAARAQPDVDELETETKRARGALALYRRRMYLGRGETVRLAELQRELQGSEARLKRARKPS